MATLIPPRRWFQKGQPPLLASADRVDAKLRGESAARLKMPEQDRSLRYYHSLPEAWYGGQFYARALPKLKLGIGHIEEDDEGETVVVPYDGESPDDKAVRQAFASLHDPGSSDLRTWATNYGKLMFVVGEGYSCRIGIDPDSGDQDEDDIGWEFLSYKELRVKQERGGGSRDAYERRRAPAGGLRESLDELPDDKWDPVPGSAVVLRFWTPDPTYSWLPDWPLRPLLDVCEELLLLTQAIHARAVNRTAGNGVFFVPNSIAQQIPDTEPATPEERQMTMIMRQVYRALTTPIANPGDASAVVPLVLTGPDEAGKLMQHVSFQPQGEWPESVLRERAMERFAMGADFPIEYLVGLRNLSHWNAWQVDDQTWSGHVQPKADAMVSDITAAMFRPACAQFGVSNPDEWCVIYDESELVTKPDKSGNAKDAYDRGALSPEALRRESAFDEKDAPTEADYRRWVGVQLKDPGLALGGESTGAQGQAAQPGKGTEEGPPPEPSGPAPAPVATIPPSMTARVLGAAEMAVAQCRERAGARIASRAQGYPEVKREIGQVQKTMIAATLGPRGMPGMLPAPVLVDGSMDTFIQQCMRWALPLDTITYWAGRIEEYAADTLWLPDDQVGLPDELLAYAENRAVR